MAQPRWPQCFEALDKLNTELSSMQGSSNTIPDDSISSLHLSAAVALHKSLWANTVSL